MLTLRQYQEDSMDNMTLECKQITMRDHRADGYDVNLTKLPATKLIAEKLGATYFFTGKPCINGHVASRYTKGGRCSICSRIQSANQQGQKFTGRTPKKLANAARKAAHLSGKTTYIPPDPCPNGHKLRFVASTNCVECDRLLREKYKYGRKERRIEKLYQISAVEHENMFNRQGRKCAICDSMFSNRWEMHIDHCHKTGRIRGLLCSCCNQAIGLLKENIKLFRKAAEYIDETP